MSSDYIAALNKQDYQAEAKYDDYEKKATKRVPIQIDFKIPKTKGNQDKMTNRDDIARLEARDSAIEAEMERVTNLAIPEMPNKFKPIVNEVTPEMIADYQEEQRKPLEIDGKFYPYHPVDLELELENLPPLETDFAEGEFEGLDRTEQQLLAREADYKRRFDQIDADLERSDREYDKQIGIIEYGIDVGDYGEDEGIQTMRDLRDQYINYVETRNAEREALRTNLESVADRLQGLRNHIEDRREEFSQNKAALENIQKENQKKLRGAEETFTLLNRSKVSVAPQGIDESDENYALRLQEEAANPPEIDPETLAERVVIRNTEKLIANLKTILKPSQASTIAKMLTPEQKHAINKFFPKIKAEFEKTYSKDVKIEEQELIDFFREVITGKKIRTFVTRKPTPEDEYRELTRRYREAEIPTVEGRVVAPPASTLTMNKMKEYLIRNHPDDPRTRMATKTGKLRSEVEQIYRDIVGERPPEEAKPFSTLGSGIKTKDLPKRSHFGKITISPYNLYHKNLLQVRNLKGQSIGVSDVKVSDGMSEMLLKMLEGVAPTKRDFAILEKNEPSLYNNLIHLAQLHKNYETPNLQETKQQMKHRMELVQGEIEAGNTAPSILSEAKQLLRLMVGNGMLKSPAARKHYDYLKNYNN
jgi:hypothetical protein